MAMRIPKVRPAFAPPDMPEEAGDAVAVEVAEVIAAAVADIVEEATKNAFAWVEDIKVVLAAEELSAAEDAENNELLSLLLLEACAALDTALVAKGVESAVVSTGLLTAKVGVM